jgi:hypothetical protein
MAFFSAMQEINKHTTPEGELDGEVIHFLRIPSKQECDISVNGNDSTDCSSDNSDQSYDDIKEDFMKEELVLEMREMIKQLKRPLKKKQILHPVKEETCLEINKEEYR